VTRQGSQLSFCPLGNFCNYITQAIILSTIHEQGHKKNALKPQPLLFFLLPYFEQVAVQEKRKSRSGAPPKKKRRTEDART